MPNETVELTFGDILKTVIDGSGRESKLSEIHPSIWRKTDLGGELSLTLQQLAIIGADNVGGRVAQPVGVEWLAGDSADSPVMSRLRIVETRQTRGKLPSAGALPTTTMQGEHSTFSPTLVTSLPVSPAVGDFVRFNAAATGLSDAVDTDGSTAVTDAATGDTFRYDGANWVKQATDPTINDHDYVLDSVVESKSEVGTQSIIQAGPADLDGLVLEAHRLAIQDELLRQILVGDGQGRNLSGIVGATGIGAATYPMTDRGKDSHFTTAEIAVEDAGGRGSYMAWALGTDLSTSARTTAIDPGSSRRVVERGRLSLSGTPAQRVGSLPGTTGVLCDWRTIIQPVSSELTITMDRVSTPGMLRLTSRLPVGDPIVSAPGCVYKLEQA